MYSKQSHEKMIVWQMADKLDILTQEVLKQIPRNEFKSRSQIDNASDSISSNFVEGYYSGSLGDYIRFCRYARRSCAELQDRVRRMFRKEFINEELFNKFNECAIKTGYLFDRLIKSLINKKNKEISKK